MPMVIAAGKEKGKSESLAPIEIAQMNTPGCHAADAITL